MKKYGKVIGLILLIAVSIYSGFSFKFPEAWGWKFSINVGEMARTFFYMNGGIILARLPRLFEAYRGVESE